MRQRILLAAFVWTLCLCAAGLPAMGQPTVGGTAPGFTLPTLAGDEVSLSDFAGKFVVLHFGAGW